MNAALQDYKLLQKWSVQMGGVYSTSDLNNLFDEGRPVALNRHIRRLEDNGVLKRFVRGYYVTEAFDPKILSARLNPHSYISLGTVLAEALVIGSVPARTLYAVKTGRNKLYKSNELSLQFVGISPRLFFGFANKAGVNIALPEKAFLDTLYFYQKGRKYSFNIFTDIDMSRLDRKKIMNYLKQYRNPKFVAFVKGYLNDERR